MSPSVVVVWPKPEPRVSASLAPRSLVASGSRIASGTLAVALAATLAGPTSAWGYPSSATLTIGGRGRAHGVGMCMGGAYGRAKAGQKYLPIIRHYYTGTTVGRSGRVPARLKVKIGGGTTVVDGEGGAFAVKNGSGAVVASVASGQSIITWMSSGDIRLDVKSGADGSGSVVKRVTVSGSLRMVPGSGTILQVLPKKSDVGSGYTHFRGDVIAADHSGSLVIVNEVGMEPYLKGIAEEPESHPTEMLRLTAVLTRTYATYRVHHPKYGGAPYHLLATADSQVYWGYDYEKKAPNLGAAVDITRGRVVLYRGEPILAAYHGTCGGHTEDNELAWGGRRIPYLTGVWCNEKNHSAPYCRGYRGFSWKTRTSFATLAKRLGVRGEITGFSSWVRGYNLSKTGSPRVYRFRVRYRVRSGGRYVSRSLTKTGAQVQRAFRFMTNWFSFDLPPTISSLSVGRASRHPYLFSFRLSERSSVVLTVSRTSGGVVWRKAIGTKNRGLVGYFWNGRTTSGKKVPAGTYVLRVYASDRRGNRNWTYRRFRVSGSTSSMAVSRASFSPAADSVAPTIAVTCVLGVLADMGLAVRDGTGATRRALLRTTRLTAGRRVFAWDGRDDAGAVVPDGVYRVVMGERPVGGSTAIYDADVAVDTVRPVVTLGPADPASFSATTGTGTAISFSTNETGTATVVVRRREGGAAGAAVRTMLVTAGAPAPVRVTWDGRDDGGTRVSAGEYLVEVRVTDAAGNRSQVPVPTRLNDYVPVTVTT